MEGSDSDVGYMEIFNEFFLCQREFQRLDCKYEYCFVIVLLSDEDFEIRFKKL